MADKIQITEELSLSQIETVQIINEYKNNNSYKCNKEKVFYKINEWQGWRFYKKAILNLDYGSLINHIKNKFNY